MTTFAVRPMKSARQTFSRTAIGRFPVVTPTTQLWVDELVDVDPGTKMVF
jgi:hypothetical protein